MTWGKEQVRIAHPLFYQPETMGRAPLSPKSLEVEECHVDLAILLNDLWHSRLPKIKKGNILRNRRQACFAIEFDGLFYATAIWTDPVAANWLKGGDKMLELRRLAIAPDAPRNTASRILKLMIRAIKQKYPELKKLLSYQDTAVHLGTIYKASGWTAATETSCIEWTTKHRKRNTLQSTATKIRWERAL